MTVNIRIEGPAAEQLRELPDRTPDLLLFVYAEPLGLDCRFGGTGQLLPLAAAEVLERLAAALRAEHGRAN